MEQTRGEPRRQALVEAAYRLLAERGFEGLRTREVAAAVGVNVATLHYYFPTKEALVAAVVEHAMTRFRSTLQPGQGPALLAGHLRAVRELLRDEPELGAVMAELALRSARDPGIREMLAGTFAAWHETMRGLLRNAVRQGAVRADLDPDTAAALVMATLTSLMLPVMAASPIAGAALAELARSLGLRQSID